MRNDKYLKMILFMISISLVIGISNFRNNQVYATGGTIVITNPGATVNVENQLRITYTIQTDPGYRFIRSVTIIDGEQVHSSRSTSVDFYLFFLSP